MIIIKDKNKINTVYFPKNIYTMETDIYNLVLVDRGLNNKIVVPEIEDSHIVPFGFYTFAIDFTNFPQGEYEYTIFDGDENIVGSGLIRLNELEDDNTYYNNDRTYVAYDRQ